ncbi:hypothetical protein [Pseudofrankia sp. DC12]|uniref:hypothetical protein n=1 Tax=Pseudofrankia sp. DC12 TaxID=683315 RepID=UPI0005F8407F|nr:hypothetical protein [Pseudofrankia sp. DC12]
MYTPVDHISGRSREGTLRRPARSTSAGNSPGDYQVGAPGIGATAPEFQLAATGGGRVDQYLPVNRLLTDLRTGQRAA